MVRSKADHRLGRTGIRVLLEHFDLCDRYGLSRFVELAIHFDVMSLMIGHCVRIGDGVDLSAFVGDNHQLGPLATCSLLEQFFTP